MLSQFVEHYQRFKARYIVQQRRKHEYAINRYYAHLIDPFFTKWAYDLRLTPNQVTVIAFVIGVLAAVMLGMEYFLAGALLLQLHHYLDGVDGNLARLTNNCTPLGAKLDRWSDQLVRAILYGTLFLTVELDWSLKLFFIFTLYFDLYIVHAYILPFARKYELHRARWKEWFLQRGIIPGFDSFTIMFLISVFAIFAQLDLAMIIIAILKTLDWFYRVWECWKTAWYLKHKH